MIATDEGHSMIGEDCSARRLLGRRLGIVSKHEEERSLIAPYLCWGRETSSRIDKEIGGSAQWEGLAHTPIYIIGTGYSKPHDE